VGSADDYSGASVAVAILLHIGAGGGGVPTPRISPLCSGQGPSRWAAPMTAPAQRDLRHNCAPSARGTKSGDICLGSALVLAVPRVDSRDVPAPPFRSVRPAWRPEMSTKCLRLEAVFWHRGGAFPEGSQGVL
jgi:hypothetical protein